MLAALTIRDISTSGVLFSPLTKHLLPRLQVQVLAHRASEFLAKRQFLLPLPGSEKKDWFRQAKSNCKILQTGGSKPGIQFAIAPSALR